MNMSEKERKAYLVSLTTQERAAMLAALAGQGHDVSLYLVGTMVRVRVMVRVGVRVSILVSSMKHAAQQGNTSHVGF